METSYSVQRNRTLPNGNYAALITTSELTEGMLIPNAVVNRQGRVVETDAALMLGARRCDCNMQMGNAEEIKDLHNQLIQMLLFMQK